MTTVGPFFKVRCFARYVSRPSAPSCASPATYRPRQQQRRPPQLNLRLTRRTLPLRSGSAPQTDDSVIAEAEGFTAAPFGAPSLLHHRPVTSDVFLRSHLDSVCTHVSESHPTCSHGSTGLQWG
jgi:hypothetical protein